MALQIAPNLTLPPNFVTDTTAVIGTRRSGKSYWASRAVEVVLDHGGQVVVIDPVGIWWGLRVAADGKGKGYPIAVFGGQHGDVPLEPTGGELVARLVVERRMSIVLDVSDMTDGEQKRFVTDFARALFNLKKRSQSPILVVFEECHEFLPNRVDHGDAPMVGAVKRLGKIGGNYGIGWLLISQRPAEVNTGALNLSNNIVVGKLKGPHDRKRAEDWVSYNDADEKMLAQIPTLQRGHLIAWIDERAPVVVRASAKRTLDTGRTPEEGDVPRAPALLPPIDLAQVREAMAATIEEAKANDPKELRKQIAALQAELRKPATATPAQPAQTKELIVYRVPDQQAAIIAEIWRSVEVIEMEVGSLSQNLTAAKGGLKSLQNLTEKVTAALARANAPQRVEIVSRQPYPPAGSKKTVAMLERIAREKRGEVTMHNGTLPAGVGDLLAVLATSPRRSMRPRDMAVLAGVKARGGAWGKKLREMRERGFVVDEGDELKITKAGIDASPAGADVPTSGPELLRFWQDRLPEASGKMLTIICDTPGIDDGALAERLNRAPVGGAWGKVKRELTSRSLIKRRSGGWYPTELFG